jgi:uncharacterized membrane protein
MSADEGAVPVAFKGVLGPGGGGVSKSVRAKQEKAINKSQATANQQHKALAVVFFLTTATSVFIGVKCVVFDFKDVTIQASMVFATVILMHAEYFMLKAYMETVTQPKGRWFKGAHHHQLYLKKLACHWCDLCHKKISEKQGWNCQPCGFDICNSCAIKNDKSRAEGVLRGDSGVKDEKEVTSWEYFCRAMRLTTPYAGLLSVSLVCLVINSVANLYLPHYTGEILDAVTKQDAVTFWYAVQVFSVSSAVVGAFGAVRNLCGMDTITVNLLLHDRYSLTP